MGRTKKQYNIVVMFQSIKVVIDKPKVVSRSQKSKADDLVFIKIAMSNHPHPPTRESFKEAR